MAVNSTQDMQEYQPTEKYQYNKLKYQPKLFNKQSLYKVTTIIHHTRAYNLNKKVSKVYYNKKNHVYQLPNTGANGILDCLVRLSQRSDQTLSVWKEIKIK